MQRECRDRKKAMNKARNGRNTRAKDTEPAKASLATTSPQAVEIESDVSAYTAFHQSDSTDFMDYIKWALDSGATRHMCGIKTLFTGLKRFAEPLQVKLADSSIIQAYGQGQIELKTGTGRNLTLREV